MKKQERVTIIINKLNQLYPNPPIPLNHTNNFTLLIAVVLSAQSTDKKVNELTPSLFNLASNPKDMILLGEKKIHSYIKEIGLSKKKAKYIYELSQKIYHHHSSNIPDTFDELEKLPGVGHKTASVIMSQAFGIPAFPVDTHIHRLSQRWGLTTGVNVRQTEEDLKRLFPENLWNKLHLQMIFYGREFCSAKGCDGTVCDLCKELYPKRKYSVKYNKA